MNEEIKNNKSKNKSFYVACVICAIAVIAAGIVVVSSINAKMEIAQEKSAVPMPIVNEPADLPKPVSKTEKPETKEKAEKPEPDTEEVSLDPLPKQELLKTKLIMPVKGIVTVNHSSENLVYSPTFEDWRVHKGIDIDAETSSQVKAVADGIIEAAFTDEMMGNVIEINHGDFVSIYAGVSTLEMISQGKEVKQGDIISGIGNTSLNEAKQNPHLHFEILYGGNSVDPIDYLKRQ